MAGRALERGRESLPLSSAPTPSPMAIDLPTGFLFRPTDEDLLDYYLRRKLANKTYPNAISELGIYDHDPSELPSLSILKSTEVWFFFARRILKDGLVIRETPSGVWLSDGDVKHIKDKSDRFIGTKQSFKFCLKPNNTPLEETNWMMEEYQRHLQVDNHGFVLCKIFLKKPPVKRTPVKRTPPATVTDTVMVEAHEEEILGPCVLNREDSLPSSDDDDDDGVRYRLPRTPVKRVTPATVTDTVMVEAHEEEILGPCVLNREDSLPSSDDDDDIDGVRYMLPRTQ